MVAYEIGLAPAECPEISNDVHDGKEVRTEDEVRPVYHSFICKYLQEERWRKQTSRKKGVRAMGRRKHSTTLLPSLPQLLLRQAPATNGCCSDEFSESIQWQMSVSVMTTAEPNTPRVQSVLMPAGIRYIHLFAACPLSGRICTCPLRCSQSF